MSANVNMGSGAFLTKEELDTIKPMMAHFVATMSTATEPDPDFDGAEAIVMSANASRVLIRDLVSILNALGYSTVDSLETAVLMETDQKRDIHELLSMMQWASAEVKRIDNEEVKTAAVEDDWEVLHDSTN